MMENGLPKIATTAQQDKDGDTGGGRTYGNSPRWRFRPMKFATADVLGVSTGLLLGDIGGIFKVMSFMLGRDAFTHELAFYGRQASAALKAAIPAIPVEKDAEHITGQNYRVHLAEWQKQFGAEMDLPDSLRDCLADDRNAIDTATDCGSRQHCCGT